MSYTPPSFADAVDEGLTLWTPVTLAQTSDREVLAQALYDAFAKQTPGMDALWIESNGNITITADEDIQLTPGGDGAFLELIQMVDTTAGAGRFFGTERVINICLDLGLQEVRIA